MQQATAANNGLQSIKFHAKCKHMVGVNQEENILTIKIRTIVLYFDQTVEFSQQFCF